MGIPTALRLPCGGYATPATYEVDRKQYVVRQGTKTCDEYVAFALLETL